jgi:hypothetical protein
MTAQKENSTEKNELHGRFDDMVDAVLGPPPGEETPKRQRKTKKPAPKQGEERPIPKQGSRTDPTKSLTRQIRPASQQYNSHNLGCTPNFRGMTMQNALTYSALDN